MLIAHEILAEWNEEKDAQYTTQQRADEHLHEVYGHFRIFVLQDVESRKGEDCACHNHTRASSDGLDNHVFSQGTLALRCTRYAHRNDGNRNGSFEHLTNLQTQVSSSCGEQYGHGNPPRD